MTTNKKAVGKEDKAPSGKLPSIKLIDHKALMQKIKAMGYEIKKPRDWVLIDKDNNIIRKSPRGLFRYSVIEHFAEWLKIEAVYKWVD